MKGFSLAFLSFLFSVTLTVALLRIRRGRGQLKYFFIAYGLAVGFYSFIYLFLPHNLWVLPPQALELHANVDFWNGILILTLMVHCFADVTYATVLTGFASNLIVHMARMGEPLRVGDAIRIYGGKLNDDPVIEWRMSHLLRKKYVEESVQGYRLLWKGRIIAVVALSLQRLFRTGSCG